VVFRINTPNSYSTSISSIAIDTNVLLWTFYGNLIRSVRYQRTHYPNFLSNAITANRTALYTTYSNIFEALHVIENNEYEIYLASQNLTKNDVSYKDYRTIASERIKLKGTLSVFYNAVKAAINIEDFTENKEILIKEFLDLYLLHQYDFYDFNLIKFSNKNNIKAILTDDIDFKSYQGLINGINIYTANAKM